MVFKRSVTNQLTRSHSAPKNYSLLMEEYIPEHIYPGFYTATVLNWKKLFTPDKYKSLIINSLSFLSEQKRADVLGFVIMPNHIHLLWKIRPPHRLAGVQRDFMKFTAQQIKQDLKKHHPAVLNQFGSSQNDRKYQFWKRHALTVFLYSRQTIEQKLDYIHRNPVQGKWLLAASPEEYGFSSCSFYEKGERKYPFLRHYMELYE